MILLCMGRDEDGDAAGLSRITGVTRDEGGHDATGGLETHGQLRRDVQQKDVGVTSGASSQNVGLDCV